MNVIKENSTGFKQRLSEAVKQFKIILMTVLSALIVTPAFAQVSITRSDLEAQTGILFDVFRDTPGTSAQLDAIINGGVADFRGIVDNLAFSHTRLLMTMPADVPGADSFATATHVEEFVFEISGGADSSVYIFSTITDDSMVVHGSGSALVDTNLDGVVDTLATRFIPKGWLQSRLPAAQGVSWNSVFDQTTWVTVPGNQRFKAIGPKIEFEYNILGSTTLTTPEGSGAAIRLHIIQTITQPTGGIQSLETFSFIAKNGLAAEATYERNPTSGARMGLNHVAHFVPKSTTAVETITSDIPTNFRLNQNYPNPFNPSTTIGFNLPISGQINLGIFNLHGQKIALLVNETMPAGSYEVQWQPENLSSGLYLYRIQIYPTDGQDSPAFMTTRKMYLLK